MTATNERLNIQLKELKTSHAKLSSDLESWKESMKLLEMEAKRLRASEEKKKDLSMINIEEMKQLVQTNMQAVATFDNFIKKYGNTE